MSSAWKSPLEGYENAEPLPEHFNEDGKSLYNPPGPKSAAYDEFPDPIDKKNNGFDFHIYYMQSVPAQLKHAKELHERIRREFPEMRIYKFWEKPVGPHPVAMFEVNTFSPHQTGTLFSFLAVNRGPCSLLAEAKRTLEDMKTNYATELALPPARARELPRDALLAGMEFSRTQDANTENLQIVYQALIGTQPKHSTKKLAKLNRSSEPVRDVDEKEEQAKPGLSVDFAIEDPKGDTSHVTIYHYPTALNTFIDNTDEVFPIGTVLAIREPYHKYVTLAEIPIVRIDAPSDIVFLGPSSPSTRNVTWATGNVAGASRSPTTASGWKDKGSDCYKRKLWLPAAISYSEGLRLEPNNHLLLLNRAATYLELGWYNSAAHDAEAVLAMDLDDAARMKRSTVWPSCIQRIRSRGSSLLTCHRVLAKPKGTMTGYDFTKKLGGLLLVPMSSLTKGLSKSAQERQVEERFTGTDDIFTQKYGAKIFHD
ncbi:hypothetical protein EUX98_g6180 [Antrodiella citrinella]|uniref:Uncharacterized protein n=1 Tax=Antrodiella citrinella TaxID=2447956 RepID=A0A4S4MQK2_9APHY|nr:hypothetical protein EUX98_g6180 [Antrodiella citrinella]